MSEPRYKRHLDYAESHESRACQNFREVAYMYMRSADAPTYGILQACAMELEKEMNGNPPERARLDGRVE